MKAKTKHLADQITQALGPIFHATPDYKTITEAIALTVARVAQSTPDRFKEYVALDEIMDTATNALTQFLNEEEAQLEAKQSTLAKGIDAFAEMARSDEPANGLAAYNGGVSPEACAEAERFAGQDHPEVERPTFQPFYDENGKITKEGFEDLKKYVIDHHIAETEMLEGCNPDEEIARFERENQDLRPNCCGPINNPDGPRAYAP